MCCGYTARPRPARWPSEPTSTWATSATTSAPSPTWGLIEEAPELAKDRRERWWRLVARSLRWSGEPLSDDPAEEAVAQAVQSLTLDRHSGARAGLVRGRRRGARALAGAAFAIEKWLHLTAEELGELSGEVDDLLARWQRSGGARRRRAPRAGPVLHLRHPRPAVTARPALDPAAALAAPADPVRRPSPFRHPLLRRDPVINPEHEFVAGRMAELQAQARAASRAHRLAAAAPGRPPRGEGRPPGRPPGRSGLLTDRGPAGRLSAA